MNDSAEAPTGSTLTERQGSPLEGHLMDVETRVRSRALDPHLLVTHSALMHRVGRRPLTVPMLEMDAGAAVDATATIAPRELMAAIAAAPEPYRDVVVAIDLLGLSYEQAARRLATSKGTINSRLFRARAHIARVLDGRLGE